MEEICVWPEPGDLCSINTNKRRPIIEGIRWVHEGHWDWNLGSKFASVDKESLAIIISDVTFLWSTRGYTRRLVYVLHPEAIGWDDYGIYNVEARP